MNILLGCDPEVFVKNGDKVVSGHGLIQGTKEHPFPVKDGAVQVDGMALEFNIKPAANEEEWGYNIESVLQQMQEMIPQHELALTPTAEFGKEYIDLQPDEAKMLGCEPDYCAYKAGENSMPDGSMGIRTAGGHVHIGWTDKPNANHGTQAVELVKQLDFYLGLPSLLFDKDMKRRSMYGQAGAYRVKDYGVEYRSLSNAWLTSKQLISLIYTNTKGAVSSLLRGGSLYSTYPHIQQVINESDSVEAKRILDLEGIAYV